jgi:hypothetical protein
MKFMNVPSLWLTNYIWHDQMGSDDTLKAAAEKVSLKTHYFNEEVLSKTLKI